MKGKRLGALLLEGIVALFIVFMVGFALGGMLLNARKLLAQGRDESQALDLLEVAFVEAHSNPPRTKGQRQIGSRTFDWKAILRQEPGFEEVEVTVFWRDEKDRLRQVSNARTFRSTESGP